MLMRERKHQRELQLSGATVCNTLLSAVSPKPLPWRMRCQGRKSGRRHRNDIFWPEHQIHDNPCYFLKHMSWSCCPAAGLMWSRTSNSSTSSIIDGSMVWASIPLHQEFLLWHARRLYLGCAILDITAIAIARMSHVVSGSHPSSERWSEPARPS